MKKISFLFIYLMSFVLLFGFTACGGDSESKEEGGDNTEESADSETSSSTEEPGFKLITKEVEGAYEIGVPEMLEEMKDLNDLASLSYGKAGEELYMIVIDFKKEDLGDIADTEVDEFYQMAVDDLSGSIKDANIEDPAEIKSKDFEQRRGVITGLFNQSLDIYYCVNVVKTDKAVYQMVMWTLGENAEKYRPLMDKAFDSFKEL